mgnify:CR=1 FL=1
MEQQTLNTIKKEFSVILALLTSYLALNPVKKNLLLTIHEEISNFIESEEDTLDQLMDFLDQCEETNPEYPFFFFFLEELNDIYDRNEEIEEQSWNELFPGITLDSFLQEMFSGMMVLQIPEFKTKDGLENWLEEVMGK